MIMPPDDIRSKVYATSCSRFFTTAALEACRSWAAAAVGVRCWQKNIRLCGLSQLKDRTGVIGLGSMECPKLKKWFGLLNLGGSSKKDHISSDISNLVGEQRGFLRDFMKKFRKHLKNNVKKLVSEGLPVP